MSKLIFVHLILDMNIKDKYKRTPLHLACWNSHSKIIEKFLENSKNINTDLNTKDVTEKTPFDLLNLKIENKWTPFHWACNFGSVKMAEIFVQKSVECEIDLNAKDVWNRTALHLTCWNGHLEIIEIILKNSNDFKIELNSKDKWGRTPLHLACWNGDTRIIEIIFKNSEKLGIDLNSKDEDGRTAFQWACENRHSKIVDIFKHNSSLNVNLPRKHMENEIK